MDHGTIPGGNLALAPSLLLLPPACLQTGTPLGTHQCVRGGRQQGPPNPCPPAQVPVQVSVQPGTQRSHVPWSCAGDRALLAEMGSMGKRAGAPVCPPLPPAPSPGVTPGTTAGHGVIPSWSAPWTAIGDGVTPILRSLIGPLNCCLSRSDTQPGVRCQPPALLWTQGCAGRAGTTAQTSAVPGHCLRRKAGLSRAGTHSGEPPHLPLPLNRECPRGGPGSPGAGSRVSRMLQEQSLPFPLSTHRRGFPPDLSS